MQTNQPRTLSFQTYNLPFLQILLTVAFSSPGLIPWIPGLFTDISEHIRILLFSVFHFLVVSGLVSF